LILISGLTTFWYANQMRNLVISTVDRNVAALRTAEELMIALVNQKGLVTYYFLSHNPDWLKQLEEQQAIFTDWLQKAQERATVKTSVDILAQLASEYANYVALRNQVIELYKEGKREKGAEFHWDVRNQFATIKALCGRYKAIHEKDIADTRRQCLSRVRLLNSVALVSMLSTLILSSLLAVVLVNQIIHPIQRLIRQVSLVGDRPGSGHEVTALSQSVQGLLKNVDQTRTELERSQERLLHSEKMAVVGKLAAEVAHSIRNPLTSIKMRLFSIERGQGLNPAQMEDLEVVSQEMRRLDTIVCNFLEFSRPPRLRMQDVDLSEIVARSLQLLEKKFERQAINVEHLVSSKGLPVIKGDPELLKEVLINLMVNACDAMGEEGSLTIKEDEGVAEHIGRAVLVRISDTGPGIPVSIQEKIMEPFFSTKEEGTGLGLSIARRIVEEHGGWLEMRSKEGQGAVFIIALPVQEENQ
ncbi:MAG: ATP-binding protein, partial [Planctomycetota bacterium]